MAELKAVPAGKSVCIMCPTIVTNVYGRIGDRHQTCSKVCNQAYEALSYEEKHALRTKVQSAPFKAPVPEKEKSKHVDEGKNGIPRYK